MEKININNQIKQKSNIQLLDDISLGKNAYQPGVFEFYLKEAENRGLEINLESITEYKKQKDDFINKNKDNSQLFLGIFFLFIAFGLFAFIPGKNLLKNGKYKKFAYFFIIWSSLIWLFVLIVVVYTLIKYILYGA